MSVSTPANSPQPNFSYHNAMLEEGPLLQAVTQALQSKDWAGVQAAYSRGDWNKEDLLQSLRTANGNTDEEGHRWFIQVLQDPGTMSQLNEAELYSLYSSCVDSRNPQGAQRFLTYADLRPLTNLQLWIMQSQSKGMDATIQGRIRDALQSKQT
jgi:hypothetical protein